MHRLKASQLFFRLAEGLLRQAGLLQLLPQFGHLFGPGVGFPQLCLDGPQLFAQEIFALGLAHLLLGLALDAVLDGHQLQFLGQEVLDPAQALEGLEDLDERLGIGDLEPDVAGDEVGETARVLDILHHHHHFRGQGLSHVDNWVSWSRTVRIRASTSRGTSAG